MRNNLRGGWSVGPKAEARLGHGERTVEKKHKGRCGNGNGGRDRDKDKDKDKDKDGLRDNERGGEARRREDAH